MESAATDHLWEAFPQDILTQIFKYLPIAPDRWNCLFVSKAFYRAMQSPLLWSHITFQDCSVMPKKRSWDELERKVNKPKKSEFSAAAFLGYLKKNHRDVVVEMDLSFTALESEGEYLPRKYNVSYSPEYNEDHMNVFWSLMFDFPNLRNLSFYNAYYHGGAMVTFGDPVNKNLRSSVRNLNLIKQNLFYHTQHSLQTILEFAPELEVLQVQEISESDVALEQPHTKLKQLLLIYCSVSPANLMEKCPNLEILVNHKYDHNWGMPEEEVAKPVTQGKDLLVVSGERKPLRDLTIENITKNAKAMQNVRYATASGVPQLADLITVSSDEHLELCLKTLKLDPNIKYRAQPDVTLDPFVLMYPYDADSENRGWDNQNNEVTAPALLYNGDTPLHYAVKKKKPTLVKILLENGANPNAQNSDYQTPICFVHDFELLNLLTEHGASLNVVDKNGWNLLMNFVANKTRLLNLEDQENGDFQFNYSADEESEARLKVFEHLIELGSDVNYQAPNGLNVLKIALSIGDTLIVDYLLKHMKTSMVEKSPCVGLLSCVAASRTPNVEMIERLLAQGADPTIVDECGQTYLHVAADRNRTKLLTSVELVEERTKLLALTDVAGYTCLHYAALPPTAEVVWECDAQSNYLTFLEKKLRRSNANDDAAADLDQFFALAAASGVIDVQAVSGETPLLLACRSFTAERKRDVVRQLLTHGANPNIVDHDGGSALIAAAYSLDDQLVEALLQHGADVAHCDNKGVNALLAAAMAITKRFNEVKVFNYQQGHRENQKKSVKESDKKGFSKIFELLLKNKVAVNQQEKLCGYTTLHVLTNMTEDIVAEWITTLVKDYGADINARSWVNEAPLHSAIKQRNVVSTKTLLQLGADVNARGFGSMTPLHYILDINQVLHSANVYTMSEDLRICVDGYKIVANTIVRYPSWMWSSLDDHSQNPVTSFYESESDHCVALFIELFKHAADKIDFNVQSFLGNLPLHGCWTLAKNITDATKIAQGVVDPNQFLLTIPLTMLKYATREQLLTKNFAETTPFEGMITSNLTTLKPNSMSGLYPGVKEAYDIVFKRCLELIGDTVDINHVITATSMQCEYNVIELLANKAKENGKFNISDLKKANHGSVSLMLTNVLTDPKIYTLLKDIVGPLWSKSLDRGHTSPTIDPALFNFVAVYSNACGYDEKVSRPKMLDELIKTGGADWNVQAANTNENLLHAALSWFRNVSGDGLLFNQIWTRKTIMEADKILYDLIKIGVDPHHKSVIGQSFADLVPQYEKILANHEILMGEQKSVQKENYFVEKKPTMLKQLMQAISVTRT